MPKPLEDYVQDPEPLQHSKMDLSKKFACQLCPERYTTEIGLSNHLTKNHSKHYKCNICYSYFNLEDAEKFKFHVYTHERKGQSESLTCIQCGQEFQLKTLLKRHLKKKGTFHDDKCVQCGAQMKTFSEYENHVRLEHENKWVYKCGHCQELFYQAKDLESHSWSNHTKIGLKMKLKKEKPKVKKPKQICEDCGTSVNNLKVHMEAVHGDGKKRFPCEECALLFKTKSDVNR